MYKKQIPIIVTRMDYNLAQITSIKLTTRDTNCVSSQAIWGVTIIVLCLYQHDFFFREQACSSLVQKKFVSVAFLCFSYNTWEMCSLTFLFNCKVSSKVNEVHSKVNFSAIVSTNNKYRLLYLTFTMQKVREEMNILHYYRQFVALNHFISHWTIT